MLMKIYEHIGVSMKCVNLAGSCESKCYCLCNVPTSCVHHDSPMEVYQPHRVRWMRKP